MYLFVKNLSHFVYKDVKKYTELYNFQNKQVVKS